MTLKELLVRERIEYTGDWDLDIGRLLERYARSARTLVWRSEMALSEKERRARLIQQKMGPADLSLSPKHLTPAPPAPPASPVIHNKTVDPEYRAFE